MRSSATSTGSIATTRPATSRSSDYKTGAIAKSASEYLADVLAFRDFQLPFYYWARTLSGDRVSRLALVPLKDALLDVAPIELIVDRRDRAGQPARGGGRGDGVTAHIDVADLERARDRMIELAALLAAPTLAHYAATDDPAACRYCSYRDACRERPAVRRRALRPVIHAREPADARVVAAPLEANLLLVTGATGSGKTNALAARYLALLDRDGIDPGATLVAAAGAEAARDLAARISARLDPAARDVFTRAPFTGITVDDLAFAIVADGALEGGLAPDIERLDPDEAAAIFERAAAPLFSAEWAEYLGTEIDPEISGLRAPDRFADAVLRLIGKLRDAGVDPETMLQLAQRGANAFYATPPNLTEPGLLYATKDEYRGSLLVGAAELERQRRREIDLAKIVAKLYRSYLDELVRGGCLGAGDAIAEAIRLLGESPALARAYGRIRFAVVDDAHDLLPGEVRLLRTLFGAALPRVTFAGSLHAAVRTFTGARPEATFKLAATTIALPGDGPVPAPIAAVARAIGAADLATAIPVGETVQVVRSADRAAEIDLIGNLVAAHVGAGTPPARIALVHRSARCLGAYADALLERNVPVASFGDIDLLAAPRHRRRLGRALDRGRSVPSRLASARAATAAARAERCIAGRALRRTVESASAALRASRGGDDDRPPLGPSARRPARDQRPARRTRRRPQSARARTHHAFSRAARAMGRARARSRRERGAGDRDGGRDVRDAYR